MAGNHGMLPIICDASFQRLCVVDNYISFIWSRRYYDVGDFELVISMAAPCRQYVQEGFYIVRDGITEAGIIEKVAIAQNLDGQEVMTITGRFISSILGRRIIAQQTQVSGTIENCIKTLINQNAISPQNSARRLPGLQYGTWSIPATTMQQQFTGKNLLEVMQDICKTYNIGFRVDLTSTNAFSLVLYTGVDRSLEQSANPYVIFSNDYDNLASSDYAESYESIVTDVLVAGEGEGLDRKTQWASSGSARGLDRYELFVDARNASTNNGEISDSVYLAQLREEGLENIAGVMQAFAGEVYLTNYELGTDFDVGDIVVVQNVRWGVSANARLVEVIESVSESGEYSVTPTFDLGEAAISGADTTGYLNTENMLNLLVESDAMPLMAENATFDAEHSQYDYAVKISDLEEVSASGVSDGNWLALARTSDTVKLAWSTLVNKLKSVLLPLTGGTLTGRLAFNNSTALPRTAATGDFYPIGINAFADGGKVAYMNPADLRTKIDAAASSHSHSNYYSSDTSRTANTVLAAPNGSAGAATFRALVAADIPNLAASKITSGTLALARGGTASDNTARAINTVFAGPSSGDAGNASWRKLAAADIPNLAASKITSGTFARARIENTDWAYLTGSASSTNYCRWRMVAGIVFVEFNYASGAGLTSTAKSFGTITTGYRPSKLVTAPIYLSVSNNNIASIWVETGGAVKAAAAASSAVGYGSLSYPLG